MSSVEFLIELGRQPFARFQVYLSDGKVYEIRHPELVSVTLTAATITTPPENPTQPERKEIVALEHVVRLVPLPGPAGGKGAAS